MVAMRVRKLKKKEAGKTGPVESVKLILVDGLVKAVTPQRESDSVASPKTVPADVSAEQIPSPIESEPAASEKPASSDGATKEVSPSIETPSVPQVDISSPKAEFSLQIGSLDQAQKSMIEGFLAMVLMPTVVVLLLISALETQSSEGARSMVTSLEFMLGAIAVLGIPVMAVSWFRGLYPKGSYGRFVSGSMLAVLLGLLLVLVLVASNLENAVASFGVALKLDWLSAAICLASIFFFVQAVSELMDNRRAWRKKMGAEVKKVSLDLNSRFLDFDYHLGNWHKGNSTAWMAYIKFLVVPIIMLVTIDNILRGLDLDAKDAIVASVSSMFGTVIVFGILMVLIRFARGFYPSGSVSRMVFGLAAVPILSLYAWEILVGSGIEGELAQNQFIIDMFLVMLPVLMHVLFIAVFEVSELKDGRREYRRWIGLPVDPYIPEETYRRVTDFDTFYASFETGSRIERYVLDKYVVEMLAIIILLAIGVSVYQSPSSEGLNENVRSYLNPPDLDSRVDSMIFSLVGLALLNTAVEFIAFSYRSGSFARLVMSGVVAVFASQWAYYFWTSLAKLFQSGDLTRAINSIMFAAFGLIIVRAIWDLYKGYLRTRNEYVGWRLDRLKSEVPVSERPLTPNFPASVSIPPGALTGEALAFLADPKSSDFNVEGVPSRVRTPSAASFSFDISYEDQSSSDKEDEQ